MAYFSRAHYRLVSPPSDTPEQIRERIIDNVARETARQERDALFPVVTVDNVREAMAWFETRLAELKGETRSLMAMSGISSPVHSPRLAKMLGNLILKRRLKKHSISHQ